MTNKEYILKHYNRGKSGKEVAEHLGVTLAGLRSMVWKYRQKGHKIPSCKKGHEVGTVVKRKHMGKEYEYVKCADGEYRHKPVKKEPISQVVNPSDKVAGSVQRIAKTRIVQTRSNIQGRPAVNNKQNPDKVAIPQQTGGRYVWDDTKRAYVYRKSNAA